MLIKLDKLLHLSTVYKMHHNGLWTLLCPDMEKHPVMQPPKTINGRRPQVDPKVMDLGDPVGSWMGFWGGNPINIFAFWF